MTKARFVVTRQIFDRRFSKWVLCANICRWLLLSFHFTLSLSDSHFHSKPISTARKALFQFPVNFGEPILELLHHHINKKSDLVVLVQMAVSSSINLDNLPLELILEILAYLPTSSLIALKLVNRRLFCNTISPPQGWIKQASSCEKTAVRRYLNERKDLITGRRKCVVCNIVAPLSRFSGDSPICRWHDAWFRSALPPMYLDSSLKEGLHYLAASITNPVWITVPRMYCAHTRDIIGWHVMECKCDCKSCGCFPVQCFVRVSPRLDGPGHCESTKDGHFMSEEHRIQSSFLIS